MFRFEHPEYLYALAILPLLVAVFLLYLRWRKRALLRLGDSDLLQSLMPDASKFKQAYKLGLFLLAMAFLIIGWSNPQWGTKREKVKQKSVDVLIALDISTSMFAEDIPPSRLDRAKRFAENLVEKLKGDRIGLILFAGSAYLQMPVTTDYAAAKLFVQSANPNLAGSQGTAMGEAISLARRSFEETDESHKALIVITDGEDHDGDARTQAEAAREEGIFLFTVGVGTAEGSFIPISVGGRNDFKRDLAGQPIRSRLNEEILKEIAENGGGRYFHISEGDVVLSNLQNRIAQMEKKELEVRSFTEYNSYFQHFIAIAVLLLIIEFLITYRKRDLLKGRDLFG